jgi:hypothetical protein
VGCGLSSVFCEIRVNTTTRQFIQNVFTLLRPILSAHQNKKRFTAARSPRSAQATLALTLRRSKSPSTHRKKLPRADRKVQERLQITAPAGPSCLAKIEMTAELENCCSMFTYQLRCSRGGIRGLQQDLRL